MPSSNSIFKILVTGDCGVGKTQLIQKKFNDIYKATVATDFEVILMKDKGIKLQMWDLSGDEKYSRFCSAYYRGADAVLILFDKTNTKSFEHVEHWYNNAQTLAPKAPIILVGTKADLKTEAVITSEMGSACAAKLGIPYKEVSAKTKTNILELFTEIVQVVLKKVKNALSSKTSNSPALQTQSSEQQPKQSSSMWNRFFSCCSFGDGDNAPQNMKDSAPST